MASNKADFTIVKPHFELDGFKIEYSRIADSVANCNSYIKQIDKIFLQENFDVFKILGQRNLSGVIGEIFSRFFCISFPNFQNNPHPDGRPDLLPLLNKESIDYFQNECLSIHGSKSIPIKSKLTPFKFGGLEVKCSIGSPQNDYKEKLKEELGIDSFEFGISRYRYLNNINYWAHHRHSSRLIGLYYDYYAKANGVPQILAVSITDLTIEDWNVVSLGKSTAKKTSNTALNSRGLQKLYNGYGIVINDVDYINKFKEIGIQLPI